MTVSDVVERFLATGTTDPSFSAWEGSDEERRAQGMATLGRVMERIVEWRARNAPLRPTPGPRNLAVAVRRRVEPMVRGLLDETEADLVLDAIPHRVEVLTVDRFLRGLGSQNLELRWTLANLLLDDLGAPPLSDDAPHLDGFCQDGQAWVLARAFGTKPRWSDPVVHECAHLLHEVDRDQVGLGASVRILGVDPEDHENFAYACELWACVLRHADGPDGVPDALATLRARGPVLDPRVDPSRLDAALDAAAAAPERGYWAIGESIGVVRPAASVALSA